MNNLREMLLNLPSFTDVHLTVGYSPTVRVNGSLKRLPLEPLSKDGLERIAKDLIPKSLQPKFFGRHKSIDFAVDIPALARFRVNAYYQRGNIALALRRLPSEIPSFEELDLPPIVSELATKPRGLVLLTGPTGSGKSTTLASMVDYINQHYPYHIVTLEDPIEYVIEPKQSFISQRELGIDFSSFEEGLRSALRQDPDVLMLGEMRDLTSISAALTLAETGHLVLATLHTKSAAETISRIVDVFPPEQQEEIIAMLSSTLEGVIAQQLLPRKDNTGLALAYEVLVATPATRSFIRERKPHLIPNAIQTGAAAGMISMEQRLTQLVEEGTIDEDIALAAANYPETLAKMLHMGTPYLLPYRRTID